MSTTSKFKEYIAPVVVLTLLCLAVTAALAFTYKIANPIIEENALQNAIKTRKELLPEADSFTEAQVDLLKTDDGKTSVTEVFRADNGSGTVMTIDTSSFGGPLTMMIGLDAGGAITGIKVTEHSDTPGVGTKDQYPAYLDQYYGLTELNSDNVKKETVLTADGQPFAYISGASVSGTAIHKGVGLALKQFAKTEGGEG